MKIVKHYIMSEEETLARLKKVKLVGHGQPEVYAEANLIITSINVSDLVPAQRYVLKDGVQKMLDLADAFKLLGVDIFGLRGALMFWEEGMDPEIDTPIPFLPPIIEMSKEPDGRVVDLINDGIHRVYAARKRRSVMNVVLAINVPKEYPYYAYALSGWRDVEEIDQLTLEYKKKSYREERYKELFRDFNAQFEGIQKQRLQTVHEKS